jgi:hypothetical protein
MLYFSNVLILIKTLLISLSNLFLYVLSFSFLYLFFPFLFFCFHNIHLNIVFIAWRFCCRLLLAVVSCCYVFIYYICFLFHYF